MKSGDANAPRSNKNAEHHAAVKLAELEQEVFQPVQSNFPIMAAIETDKQISVGTRRVLWEMKRDDQGYEVGANDYKATLWHDDHEHEAIDQWRRLRDFAGLSSVGKLDLQRALRIAARFFQIEELRRATVDALPTVETPKTINGAVETPPTSLPLRRGARPAVGQCRPSLERHPATLATWDRWVERIGDHG